MSEVEKKVEKTEKEKLLERAQAILKEHDNLESQIPLNSEYWTLMNMVRSK